MELFYREKKDIYLESKYPIIDGYSALYYFVGDLFIEAMIRHDKVYDTECIAMRETLYITEYKYCRH